MRAALWLAGASALAACGGGDAYVVVTVDSRPAVHDATTLRVTVMNGGATLSNDLPLAGHAFPVTFSLSSATATGDLTVGLEALDANMSLVGQAQLTTALDAQSAEVMLDTADFVVNTEYAMDQFLSDDFEATGVQLAATPDQTWTVSFRDDCNSPCNMYGRRFDATGVPSTTVVGAGTNQFNLSTTLTNFLATPAIATAMTKTLAFWDSHDDSTMPSTEGISCRALDATGNAADFDTLVAIEAGTDVVSAVGLADGNFAVTWSASNPITTMFNLVIRSVIVGPDCTAIGSPITLSPSTAVEPRRSHVAQSGDTLLYAWVDSGDLHVRTASASNVPGTGDIKLITHTATDTVQHVRLAALPGGDFAVAVRFYSISDQTAPGKIVLYHVTSSGILLDQPLTITDKGGSDFASQYSFGMAARADGTLLVTWHACGVNGDGQGCGVFAQLVGPSGALVGTAFGVPTTTLGDQTDPSVVALTDSFVVAWGDMSAAPPDISGLAVRARVVYPPTQ